MVGGGSSEVVLPSTRRSARVAPSAPIPTRNTHKDVPEREEPVEGRRQVDVGDVRDRPVMLNLGSMN
jgi:hypothetical protein